MTDADLQSFVSAQNAVRDHVRDELQAGHKRSHWMWFVFPQLRGLGSSAMAQRYGLASLDQAQRYLADPLLGGRLRADVATVLTHGSSSARRIFGTPDDLKFRSCMTLFLLASDTPSDIALFQRALDVFYAGQPDEQTMRLLDR